MTIPPSIVWVWVAGRGGWGVPIILPVVLVWPVVVALWLVALPVLAAAALALRRCGRGRGLLLGPLAVFRVFCAMRGFRLNVSREEKMSVRIWVI
jgi:hypothetical protein